MICVPFGGWSSGPDAYGPGSMRELLKNLRRATKAIDLVEIRADLIRDFSLSLLLKQKVTRPLIFTCYAKANGGCFNGTEAERVRLLSDAIISGRFKYVTIDIPESLKIPGAVKALIDFSRRCKTKTILAYHNYRRTPDNLEAIYKRIAAYTPDAVKIVTYAGDFRDNFKIFRLAQRIKPRGRPKLIAFCMGEKGVISRILYRKFGLFLTYASYQDGGETAEGQISFAQMKYLYRADSISPNTKIFGLLGYPIGHSRSPFLFNSLFRAGGINAVYLPFAIEPKCFLRDFSLVKSFLKPAGFSITSPHKIRAMKVADKLSRSAKEIGAINTLYRKGKELAGTNTDWIGIIESLLPLRKLLKDRKALILGKGGASRAIVYALRHSGIKTVVFSRNSGKGAPSLRRLPQHCKGSGVDKIFINATPVGMIPDIGKSPVPKSCLKKGMIVFDTIYNPAQTRLIKDARSKGCITVNGLKMFLAQAFKQLECFTGRF
ncbi:MAG: type I 3-dehydroquinate dehydratase [Planctomycetes bacterium]|nr:type I 3-dehydroquinate dehydratase [Planctomycetota bacterium]